MNTIRIKYDDQVVRWFLWASIGWGIVGMLVGVIVATQLSAWQANFAPYLTFGRLRPLHTNAVIFAFVGNMVFAGIYHSTQRLLKARLANDWLSRIHFFGWQAIIVAAAITLPLGITQGKEYAELEWPIDIAIAVIWVVFAVNFFWTLAKRNEKHLYVAIWFYIATILTVAILHIVNSLALPVGILKSYSIFSGVQDALVQWWYGHNAVAFFLTTPVLGIMYYYLPKAANRPVFSYRLSIVHFWALVFIYIWAGPHHLLYTALPDWAQTLGMVFSLALWAPSWGGMLNGLLTLRGAWDKLRVDPILKFLAAGVTFYGMATFEGPLLAIKSVSGLAHYTDWIIGHVHSGALGWNGLMAAGMFYYLVPRLYGRELHSRAAANMHFYLATSGILLYIVSMWVSGITQGLMWRAVGPDGGLTYPAFVETVKALRPMYYTRLVGGTLYLAGMCLMAWNLLMTARAGKAVETEIEVVVEDKKTTEAPWQVVAFGKPVMLALAVAVLGGALAFVSHIVSTIVIVLAVAVAVLGTIALRSGDKSKPAWHRLLEGRALLFTIFTLLAVLAGGIAEIVPTIIASNAAQHSTAQRPYTSLELEGRDVYLQEGCYTCHSQMIRPFAFEAARYGAVSTPDDSIWDHPFQWGSKRTGPDLAREGGKYPNLWHYQHLLDPREITPGSIMPSYAHLGQDTVNFARTSGKVSAMRTLGVPYTDAQVASAAADARRAGLAIAADLRVAGHVNAAPESKLVALIAYLQRLGKVSSPELAPGGANAPATPSAAGAAR
jgi:cytochrome c oxidase cbb3-type subunit I/II